MSATFQAQQSSNRDLIISDLPRCEAVDKYGSHQAMPMIVSDLPHNLRQPVMDQAKKKLNVNIHYGTTVASSNNMKPSEVKADSRTWLTCKGCDLPLALFMDKQ